ncbi:hypothetical protein J7T55_000985 [Diaporthe amygdali]|uniref:uncharacterized protein n=1 Tax=Phomopsis amygdali TaxID=1214568 RepID=UPI0022FDE229|nr:uncharacterized protein J7T55_000985 [Diaporthe amygdali]KAJ0120130.1 hypothetical protein J7T55_000985 [Diaporthe amygdali]
MSTLVPQPLGNAAKKHTSWRTYLLQGQPLDPESSLELNKLCEYCQAIWTQSIVSNDLRWCDIIRITPIAYTDFLLVCSSGDHTDSGKSALLVN